MEAGQKRTHIDQFMKAYKQHMKVRAENYLGSIDNPGLEEHTDETADNFTKIKEFQENYTDVIMSKMQSTYKKPIDLT